MAISSSTRKAGPFIGNDATTVFPFAFKVFTAADLRVVNTSALGVESDLVIDVDYTVSLNADQDNDPGGSVTRLTALPTGQRLTITSDVEALQPLVLTNNGGFYPRVINDAFDKITIIAQQLIEQVGRSLKLPISSSASATLPDPVANRLIAWNSSANGFTNVDPASLATVAAYADANLELFNGNGTQTAFTLAEDPAVLANLDVSISGVTQVGGEDFTWIGTTLTFLVAPPNGTRIQVRYTRAIPPVDLASAVAAAEADRVATAADREQTGLDRVQTGADRVQTGLDVVATAADAAATAADREQTGLDRVQTGADVVTAAVILSGKQPLDADLTAIAALTSAADKMPYATGAQTWAMADLTTAGRALLDDADAAAQRTTLAAVGTAALAASTGAALVGSIQSGAGAVAQTVQVLQRERVHVSSYGAIGDGSTDDTAALQACYTAHPGAIIDHGNGKTYIVASTLNVGTGSILQGASTIKAKNATAIAGAMLLGTAVSDVRVRDLKLNGNASGSNGATFGVFFTGGSRNVVEGVHVFDTLQAGIKLESESGSKVLNSQVITCGRTGLAENHGIQVYSITSTPCQNIVIAGNTVTTAFRKGITTYSTGVGVVREVTIYGNTVNGCGLGGIYIGSDSNTYPQLGILITGNVCFDNYVNITLASTTGGVVSGNTCRDDNGGGGIEVIKSDEYTVSGNLVSDSTVHGIQASKGTATCVNGAIIGNTVTRSNTSTSGFGCGILLEGATNTVVAGNTVTDSAARMTYGIAENGTADQNVIGVNKVLNATAANYLIIGASTSSITQTGRMTGIGVAVPLNTLHVGGGVTVSTQNWTLANTNDNTVLPSNPGALVVSGPSANYTLSGIAGGHNGQLITVFNYTSYTMQLLNNDAGSSVGNRFLIGGGSRTVASFGAVQLMYSSQASAWTVVGSQG